MSNKLLGQIFFIKILYIYLENFSKSRLIKPNLEQVKLPLKYTSNLTL